MAAYDEMGNYTGYDESYSEPVNPYDFQEEEKRKEELRRQLEEEQARQEQLASQVAHKQEITTMADGSQVEKTTRHLPAQGPVNPADYNARIAQQESGNRPNIGYHNQQLGSAYGPYGTTAAGWEDARKLNPNLPQDITQATPEQLTAGQNAYTQQNAKYLQNYGVPVNEQTLGAAHFLGAKGLSDYLKTGQISEAAAKANGGYENAKRIVDARLGGQAAAASGAVQPQALAAGEQGGMPTQKPQLQPISPEQEQFTGQGLKMPGQGPAPTPGLESSQSHIERYQQDQNNPAALMKLSTDETTPDWMKDRARNRAADLITQQREMANAQEKVSTMNESELAKALRERTTGGSWVKAILYAAMGAKNLAQEEGAKLGLGSDKTVTGADGKAYMVKVAANGTPLEGFSAETGKKLTPEELISAVGGAGGAKWQTSAEQFQDKEGNIYRTQSNEKGQLVTKNVVTGEVYKGDPTKLTRVRDVAATTAAEKKQEYRRENINSEVMAAIQRKRGQDVMGALADYESQSSKPLTDEDRMAFMRQYGGLAVPGTTGQAVVPGKVTAPVAPMAQAPAVQAPAAVAPQAVAPQAAPAEAQPVKPGVDASGVPVRLPTEGAKAFEKRYKDYQEQQESIRKTQEKAAAEIAKAAGEAVAASPQTITNLNKIDKAITHLDKGNTNFGAAGGGLRKGELSGGVVQDIGRFLNTEDARNTQDVIEAVNGVVLERANLGKMTDADLKFYTAGKPTIDDSPERVKEWLETARADIKNKLEFNKQQAAAGGRKGPMEQPATPVVPPPSVPSGTSKIINGVTYVYDGKGWKKK